ncbi:MAG: hypothetical protein RL329_1020, partial [Bacteroidota bacterium]
GYTLRRVVLRYYWNADDADWADFRGFFLYSVQNSGILKKSVKIRPIRVIRVPIVSQKHPT